MGAVSVKGMRLVRVAALVAAVFPALVWADEQALLAAIDAKSGAVREVSQKIFEFRELGQQEFKSSQLVMEELRKLGFKVEGNLKVPEDLVKGGVARTAFRAELAGKGPGPTVTVMLEYDALPNGHSCGHNLISGSGLLAVAGLAEVMKDLPGRLLVIGTPDEERGSLGGGKIALLEGKHFEGSDVVLITHPGSTWSVDKPLLAMKRATFVFKGKAAHAAAAPEQGINALDAAIQTFNGINALRQHLRQDVRIHGIIKKGGDAVNVVPALAEVEFAARALDTPTMLDAYGKLINAAKAAAMAAGATMEYTPPRTALLSPVMVPEYLALVRKNIREAGVPAGEVINDPAPLGSSDLGNVGHAYPTVNIMFKVAPEKVALHEDAMLNYTVPSAGWPATVQAAKAMALTAHDLLNDPALTKRIVDKFKSMKATEGK
ncbi:amidohydrolase [uncultured Propionivibrio sp.]|uniref:amidohydrolase n=1 Tax=uncultured Propionivibrio sp. TaxID=426737 RepID=UPI0029BFCC99|nr:amidohydrolase [uncultured Propionivibrio sp.]